VKVRFFLLFFIVLFFYVFIVGAVPMVSFTMDSNEGVRIFSPILNADVSHYRWDIHGGGDSYDFHTDWIPAVDVHDHVSVLERGTYYITLEGKNVTSGLTCQFTNELTVYHGEGVVVSDEEEVVEGVGSRIINGLPEPLRSFMLDRSEFELFLMVFGFLFLLAIVSRRRKVNKYLKLERYDEK